MNIISIDLLLQSHQQAALDIIQRIDPDAVLADATVRDQFTNPGSTTIINIIARPGLTPKDIHDAFIPGEYPSISDWVVNHKTYVEDAILDDASIRQLISSSCDVMMEMPRPDGEEPDYHLIQVLLLERPVGPEVLLQSVSPTHRIIHDGIRAMTTTDFLEVAGTPHLDLS